MTTKIISKCRYSHKLAGLFCATVLIALIRSYDAFRWPLLLYEDGALMFAHYINHPGFSGVFRFYNNYVTLLPNIIGWISTRFPPLWAPYLMAVYSLVLTSSSYCIFAMRRFRHFVPDDITRIIICMFLISMPLGNFVLSSSLIFSSWHLLWIYLMFSLVPHPLKLYQKVMEAILLSLAAWSHPLSMIALPVYGIRLMMRRTLSDRVLSSVQILVLLSYLKWGMNSIPKMAVIGLDSVAVAWGFFLQRVIFESFFGGVLRYRLLLAGKLILVNLAAMMIIILIAGTIISIRKVLSREILRMLLLLGLMVFCLTFGCVVSRHLKPENFLELWSQRYFYLQQMMLLIAVASLAAYSFKYCHFQSIRIFILTVCIGLILFRNVSDLQLFPSSESEGRRLNVFLRSLNSGEGLDFYLDSKTGRYLFNRNGRWDIIIIPKPLAGNRVSCPNEKRNVRQIKNHGNQTDSRSR